ncbi:hypothetical protein VTL71DRAFT_3346 [Oculimacula yallundae]|uniref:Uncharacterized protein n=1 Tax=Oculimacula yallundae TaxID=86028 RepID=A0ABR4C820_9HELO
MLSSNPILSLAPLFLLLLSTPLLAAPTSDINSAPKLDARQCEVAVPLRCDNTAITLRDGNTFIADCRWSNLRCVENGFEWPGARCTR